MMLLEAIRILSTTTTPLNETGGGAPGSVDDDHHDGNSSSHNHKSKRRRRRRRRQHTLLQEEDDNKSSPSCLLIPGLPDDIALNCLSLARRSDHPSLACLNSRYNSLIHSGYLYDLRQRMGIVEHWVYLVCDLRGWEAFDPMAGRWMCLPNIPCDDCFTHADKESLAVGPNLLVFGRELWDFAVWAYYAPRKRRGWTRCSPMNIPRCLFASGSSGPIAIIAGGSDKVGAVLRSAELYDSNTGRWELLPDMHSPRKLCSGFFMGGKFYVIGGMSGPNAPLTCGEEYDLQSRTWRRIEGMCPTAGRAAGAPPLVAVVNDQLYAVEHHTNMVKRYDRERNGWEVIGRLPVRADLSNGWGLALKSCGKELLVVGGQRGIEGESIVLSSWRPGEGSSGGGAPEWKVIGVKEHAGVFVYNCAVMGY